MSDISKPIVNPEHLERDNWRRGTVFESSGVSFGALLGLKDLGIGYDEVPPGKSSCPYHNHHNEEELFVILAGEGEYRFGMQRYKVSKGDVLGAPKGGPETAHALINTGSEPLKYLAISANASTDIVEYPDSGKFLAKARNGNGGEATFRFIGREDSAVDYWDGEPGA